MKDHLEKPDKRTLEERLQTIKDGDRLERERLIGDYIPFIVKNVSRCMGRYVDPEHGEELTVGLEAFNEALDRYSFEKGNFISYAALVISSRVKDHLRKERKYDAETNFTAYETERGNPVESAFAQEDFTEAFLAKEQLRAFKSALKAFGVTLDELADQSPKHEDTRLNALEMARFIAGRPELVKALMEEKKLPAREIRQQTGYSSKVIRKSAVFILAAVLIYASDWDHLKRQLPETVRKEAADR